MGLLSWLRGIASARAQKVAEGVAGMQLSVLGGGTPPRRGTREMLRAYGELPWLNSVVSLRAEALASTEWVLYRAKRKPLRSLHGLRAAPAVRERAISDLLQAGQIEAVHEHDLLDVLDRPNPGMTGGDLLELYSKYEDLVGENILGLERQGGRPIGVLPMAPTWMRRAPTSRDDRYHFVDQSGAYTKPARDVIWVRKHDPSDPYAGRGVGTAGSLKDELETDEYMAEAAKARFYNRAAPDLLIGFEGTSAMQQTDIDIVNQKFLEKHRGAGKAGGVHFFGRAFRAQQLGHTMVESQYVQGRQMYRDFVMQTFRVPPELLGVLDNANRSTIDAAELLFIRFGMLPVLERLRRALQTWLVPEFGRDLLLSYVNPVPSDRESQRSVMVALPSAFRVDEVRVAGGHAPLPNGEGKAMMVAPGAPRVPVSTTPQDAAPAKKKPAKDTGDEPEEE